MWCVWVVRVSQNELLPSSELRGVGDHGDTDYKYVIVEQLAGYCIYVLQPYCSLPLQVVLLLHVTTMKTALGPPP